MSIRARGLGAGAQPPRIQRIPARGRFLRGLPVRSMVVLVALVAALALPAVSSASPREVTFAVSGPSTNAWLVQFRPDVPDSEASTVVASVAAAEIGDMAEINTHVAIFPAGYEREAAATLAADP